MLASCADLCYIINVEEIFTFNPQTVLYIQTMTTVLIHCKPEILQEDIVKSPDITVANLTTTTGEVNLYVDDVPYEYVDGTYQDPDEELCEFYGINYDLVNCIEEA